MQKRITLVLAVVFMVFSSVSVFSQTGRIAGKISDVENFGLAAANVFIESLGVGTASNQNGEYIIQNIPAGTYNVRVSFIGYQSQTKEVQVNSNSTTEVNFSLNPGILVGDEVYVIGERLQGQARALNQQRNNANITNVVAADQIGRFPDANIGDALKRIPAITVNYDQGEARFANIRGTEPRFNSITINGERIPSAEAEIRSVQLDLVPSDMVQTIEVNKVVTPDMDGDAIGGSVNLVTRQAPSGERISATIGSGYNFLRERPQLVLSGVYANRYKDDKLGVVISGSIYDNILGSDNSEGAWTEDNGMIYPEEWEIRKYEIRRLRQSVSAALDYEFNLQNKIYFSAIYNHRNDWENRFRVTYEVEPDANGLSTESTIERQTKGGIDDGDTDNRRLEDQRMWSANLRGEHYFSGLKFDWGVQYSKASEDRPNERYIEWELEDVELTVDYSDLEKPYILGDDYATSAYSLKEITEEHQYTEEKDFVGKVNLTVPFSKDTELKIGGKYRNKEKERDNDFFEYTPLTGFSNMSKIANKDYSDDDFLAGDYRVGILTTQYALGNLDLEDASQFEKEDKPDEYAADNFNATEKVYAGYAMIKQNFGKDFQALAGIRLENTSVEYTGNEFNEETETITPRTGDASFTNFMPNVQVKMNLDDNTIIRAAWSNTIARPNYYDLVPYRAIEGYDDGAMTGEELAEGNPDLEPTTSMNFDLMAEKYFANVGIISAGVFYKKISDWIYVYNENNYVDPSNGFTYEDYFQPRNGAEASLFGFEVAFQRNLGFIGLNNLSIYTNYTFTSSSADNPVLDEQVEGDADIDLPGTAPHVLNAALTYEDNKVILGVSFNYSDAYLDPDELDITPGLERYYDSVTYLDVSGGYKFTPTLRFFFELNNILNQPLRYYAGESSRTYQAEYYDMKLTAGIKFNL